MINTMVQGVMVQHIDNLYNTKFIATLEFQDELRKIRLVTKKKASGIEWAAHILWDANIPINQIKVLQDLVIYGRHIWPIKLDKAAHVAVDDDSSLGEMYKIFAEEDALNLPYQLGNLHEHHTMAVTPSGVDIDDLKQKHAAINPFYLSVIVNYAGDVSATISFPGKSKSTNKFDGETNEQSVCYIMKLNVEKEIVQFDNKEWLDNLITNMAEAYEKTKKVAATNWGTSANWGTRQQSLDFYNAKTAVTNEKKDDDSTLEQQAILFIRNTYGQSKLFCDFIFDTYGEVNVVYVKTFAALDRFLTKHIISQIELSDFIDEIEMFIEEAIEKNFIKDGTYDSLKIAMTTLNSLAKISTISGTPKVTQLITKMLSYDGK